MLRTLAFACAAVAACSPIRIALAAAPAAEDCAKLAALVQPHLTAAGAAQGDAKAKELAAARGALRKALATPEVEAGCWAVAAKVAAAGEDRELSTFALEGLRRLKAEQQAADVRDKLESLAIPELLKKIPADSSKFSETLKKAQTGDAAAMTQAGDMYSQGAGVPADDEFGVEWYTKAAAKGDADGMTRLGERKMAGRGVAKDEPAAVKLFIAASDKGSARAMVEMAKAYLNGTGVPTDDPRAFQWLERAADAKSAEAMLLLSTLCSKGVGTEASEERAFGWCQKAADLGDPMGLHLAGVRLIQGNGVGRDAKRGVELLAKARDKGDAEIRVWAGLMMATVYKEGAEGVPRDQPKAAGLIREAHEAGVNEATETLALLYSQAEGVELDDKKATELYRKAADRGSPSAMRTLGIRLSLGLGCTRDDAAAKVQLKKAAEAGDTEAAEWLGKMK